MKSVAPSRVNAESVDLPIARLDAGDLELARPIREYLEQNGCAVVVNRNPAIHETYHIICGELDFVKESIAPLRKDDPRPFVVLFVPSQKDIADDITMIHAKIAVVTTSSLSAREVEELFAFFFTGNEQLLVLENKKTQGKGDADPISVPTHRQKRKKMPVGLFGRILLVFIGLVMAPTLWYLTSIAMIVGIQWYGVGELRRGESVRTPTVVRLSSYWIGQGSGVLGAISLPMRTLGLGHIVRTNERVLSIAGDMVAAERAVGSLLAGSRAITPIIVSENVTTHEAVSLPVVVDRVRLALDDLANSLGLIDAQVRILVEEKGFPFSFITSQSLLTRVGREASKNLEAVDRMRNIVALYRAAGGFDQKKTYLLILQNSMELRPTGGFVGSIAVVTFVDGYLRDLAVQDVYALDGQLKGHVDPPTPIKELLNQENWYLRDSNWDPDFRAAASQAAWFYQKESGNSVDGVIGVSLPFLTDLLAVTGPLDLPDYNDRITVDNFFGKSLFYTKADFFPGSTQKKDFLSSLTMAIITRVTSGSWVDTIGLARVLGGALDRGDIQFWFSDGFTQALAEHAGWSGALTVPLPCEQVTGACMVDRIGLVEANMGVNKVNYFIHRSASWRTDIGQDGAIDGTIGVVYQNTSTDDAALSGGGVYRTYLRAYLPTDALILGVTLDGIDIPFKPKKQVGSLVVPYRDSDTLVGTMMVIGVAFDVPPSGNRTLAITYRRGLPFLFDGNRGDFVMQVRRQPGAINTTLDVAIGYPAGWQAVVTKEQAIDDASSGFLANARELRYNTTLDRTEIFPVRFIK